MFKERSREDGRSIPELDKPEDILAFEKSEDATSAVKLMGVAPSQKL